MSFYRVKPVVVKATQWHKPGDHDAVMYGLNTPEGLVLDQRGLEIWAGAMSIEDVYVVHTPQGPSYVSPGDWIVRNHDGSFTVLNSQQFNMLYEFAAE